MSNDQPSTSTDLLHQPPSSKWRTVILLAIAAFLVVQLWIPISYYLQNEPTSERFAWRMFSSVDLSTWDTTITLVTEKNGQRAEQVEPIATYLQEAHVRGIRRAQLDLVEPLMRNLLQRPDVREVRYLARGSFPSGKAMEPIQLIMRQDGLLQKVGSTDESKG